MCFAPSTIVSPSANQTGSLAWHVRQPGFGLVVRVLGVLFYLQHLLLCLLTPGDPGAVSG